MVEVKNCLVEESNIEIVPSKPSNFSYSFGDGVEDVKEEDYRFMLETLNSVITSNNFLVEDIFGRFIGAMVFRNSVKESDFSVSQEKIKEIFSKDLYRINEVAIINISRIIQRAYAYFNYFNSLTSPSKFIYVSGSSSDVLATDTLFSKEESEKISSERKLYNRLNEVIYRGLYYLLGNKGDN